MIVIVIIFGPLLGIRIQDPAAYFATVSFIEQSSFLLRSTRTESLHMPGHGAEVEARPQYMPGRAVEARTRRGSLARFQGRS